ncbi:MAG: N-6 DNA methylase, partial [Acidimicrobiia bacterium]
MKAASSFGTVRSEGGLLPVDLLLRVSTVDPKLPGLSPAGYHLVEGERLNEAINRSWNRLVGAWSSFRDALANVPADERTATSVTRSRWLLVLFQELGYGQLQSAKSMEVDGKTYAISHSWGSVPIHLVGARVDLDRRSEGVVGAATMSPHGLVQEYLNRSDDHLWGFVSNGLRLRLLRDNAALTRQAYVEFDLQSMFDGQEYADFAVLWLLCHQSRVEGDQAAACVLEQWSAEAAKQGVRALDQLQGGVKLAIEALGSGFLAHPANAALRDDLKSGALDRQDYYRQLLRLVYRLLFLFVAEDRDLLLAPDATPTARDRYRQFYASSRIRELAQHRRGSPHGDLWSQLTIVFDGLSRSSGMPAIGLPALGSFLWSRFATPSLDRSAIANRHLLEAVLSLTSVAEGKVRRTVDYRNLGSEELGSIYESLLEMHPNLSVETKQFKLTTVAGNERKTTGSYYTPTSLITELLDSALDPVLAEAASQSDAEHAILDLKVLDPACGSGHFLIAAAHRIAKRLASVRTGDDEPSPEATRRALRDVVGHCLHGIDLNPMAVELCKVSLWMEAMEPGKPLSFLEHRIVRGNALLGATPALLESGVPDEAFKALTGDDKTIVTALKKRNKAALQGQTEFDFGGPAMDVSELAKAVAAIDEGDDTSMDGIEAKARRWSALVDSPEYQAAVHAADTWCVAFVAPKRAGSP